VTHHPIPFPGSYMVEGMENRKNRRLISLSICDAVGIVPAIMPLVEKIDVESVSIISLHPWLSYQNLLDGTVGSVSSPGHSWGDYSLGRASTDSLIPKKTTIGPVLTSLLENIEFSAISFRTPTAIVTSAIITVIAEGLAEMTQNDIRAAIRGSADKNGFLTCSDLPLVSIDYKGREESAIVEERFIEKISKKACRMVCWYDNEFGYAASCLRKIGEVVQGE